MNEKIKNKSNLLYHCDINQNGALVYTVYDVFETQVTKVYERSITFNLENEYPPSEKWNFHHLRGFLFTKS